MINSPLHSENDRYLVYRVDEPLLNVRISAAAAEDLRKLALCDSEAGRGLLLGTVEPSQPESVTVSDLLPIQGPWDPRVLGEYLQQWPSGFDSPMAIVGLFEVREAGETISTLGAALFDGLLAPPARLFCLLSNEKAERTRFLIRDNAYREPAASIKPRTFALPEPGDLLPELSKLEWVPPQPGTRKPNARPFSPWWRWTEAACLLISGALAFSFAVLASKPAPQMPGFSQSAAVSPQRVTGDKLGAKTLPNRNVEANPPGPETPAPSAFQFQRAEDGVLLPPLFILPVRPPSKLPDPPEAAVWYPASDQDPQKRIVDQQDSRGAQLIHPVLDLRTK